MSNVLRAGHIFELPDDLRRLFGDEQNAMADVAARAVQLYPDNPPIVWECDGQTFGFSYVSDPAVTLLGYPRELWLQPNFWAQTIVHDDDRDDAVTYCALATAKARDHLFEYRARAADGRILWLRDVVVIVRDPAGGAARLRGAMFDVTAEKLARPSPAARVPAREALVA